MVHKPDIQYIQQFYVYGSEAKVVELKPVPKKPKTKLPKPKVEKVTNIYIDPLAVCGLVVAAVMLVVMIIGLFQFRSVCREQKQLENYMTTLEETSEELETFYHSQYNLDEIRERALAIGMVPIEENPPIPITVTIPEPEPEPTAWDNFVWFISGLFA